MSDASPTEPPGSGAPPTVPGYTLEALLGRGGSGEVWRAVPRRGGPAVAVKVLVAGDPQRQAREAALLGELDHPHLVRLHEVVHQPTRGGEPRVALVLDLLPGGSLAALLARRGRLRPGEVVTAIAPVAAALAHAHENGVVHGDLSPGNIVFTAEGRPVLTDLGVARVLGESAAAEVTPAYVDPTVARGGAPGPASDVFGVAAAAFHALTGVAPWNAATPGGTLAVAASGDLPDLAELAAGAPSELLAVIARGLAPDPHDRGSAAAFALDLRHACRPEPVRLPVAGVPDQELALTGRGARTELTHQIPGRRPRVVPEDDEPARRRRPWWGMDPARRLSRSAPQRHAAGPARTAVDRPAPGVVHVAARRAVLVVAVLAGLAGAVWLGVHWGGAGQLDVAAHRGQESGPAAVTGHPRPDTDRSAAPVPESRTNGAGLADGPHAPATPVGWQALVEELYRRRAEAFTTGMTEPLTGVYSLGSTQRTADEESVRALAAAGEALRGFAPTVVRVTDVESSGDRVILELVDRWAGYVVVPAADPDGPALRPGAGRAEAPVRMVVVRTDGGWRIERAERSG